MCNVPRIAASFLGAGLLLAAGCADKAVHVHGKVTIDGTPVHSGAITFLPEDKTKGPTAGASITEGGYEVVGNNLPPPGTYRVEIRGQKKTGKKVPAGSPSPPGTMVDETVEAVSAKYNEKSELKRELKAGDNTLDFELTTNK